MKSIDGATKVMGLLGHGTQYTLSPTIHNACFRDLGLNLAYLNFDLESQSLEGFLESFIAAGGRYLNVTKPYKTKVASMVGLKPGSYNTLKYDDAQKSWAGTSTDGIGFLKSLERFEMNFADLSSVVIFGFGGSVQSILQVLERENQLRGIPVFIVVRQPEKAQNEFNHLQSASTLNIKFARWSLDALAPLYSEIGPMPIVIQGSSAPSHGDRLESFVSLVDNRKGYMVDLIYDNPSQLYFEAMHAGWSVQDGLTMLIEQARASQKFWWGKCASYETIFRAIKDTGRFLSK